MNQMKMPNTNELLEEIEKSEKGLSDHDLAVQDLEQEKKILELTQAVEKLNSDIEKGRLGISAPELEIQTLEQELRLLKLKRDLEQVQNEIEELSN